MTTNPIRDAIALVVTDYFERDLSLTEYGKKHRTARDLVDDIEAAVTIARVIEARRPEVSAP